MVYHLVNIHLLNWPEKHKFNHPNFKMPQALAAQGFVAFSSVGYRIVVGVIRPSSRKPLRHKGLVGIAQIYGDLREKPVGLAAQDLPAFSQ